MLLIATDEAGYGPKLGPLVITGTAWEIPSTQYDTQHDDDTLENLFASLRTPVLVDGEKIVIDDSKVVFKPTQGLGRLHAVASAAVQWTGGRQTAFTDWLTWVARHDMESIRNSPWLAASDGPRFLDPKLTKPLLQSWGQSGVRLTTVRSRIITARAFNTYCHEGQNKADLLSESTLGIVRSIIDSTDDPADVLVYCDRHGGRRYYGAVLQATFPEWQMRVVSEHPRQSRYRLTSDQRAIDVAFTVKGDRFTPVALSSMIAKYTRERLMSSLNDYFQQRHRGPTGLRPTAGYPVDADRFLIDIAPIIDAERIDRGDLIRTR